MSTVVPLGCDEERMWELELLRLEFALHTQSSPIFSLCISSRLEDGVSKSTYLAGLFLQLKEKIFIQIFITIFGM